MITRATALFQSRLAERAGLYRLSHQIYSQSRAVHYFPFIPIFEILEMTRQRNIEIEDVKRSFGDPIPTE